MRKTLTLKQDIQKFVPRYKGLKLKWIEDEEEPEPDETMGGTDEPQGNRDGDKPDPDLTAKLADIFKTPEIRAFLSSMNQSGKKLDELDDATKALLQQRLPSEKPGSRGHNGGATRKNAAGKPAGKKYPPREAASSKPATKKPTANKNAGGKGGEGNNMNTDSAKFPKGS